MCHIINPKKCNHCGDKVPREKYATVGKYILHVDCVDPFKKEHHAELKLQLQDANKLGLPLMASV